MMSITREEARKCLCRAVGCDDIDFRKGQWEAIAGVLHGRRQLVVQRTGWGKSMIYFLAAKFLREQGRGMTLLISPLLALMRNQVAAAERVGVRCFTINSTNPKEWDGIREKILSDTADLLIVSPERLANDNFRATILSPITSRIGLLVVDEAHCVSDWGHDFRPDYKKISRLLEHLPRTVPVLATTATATKRVIVDIEAQLGGSVQVSRGSLVRKSLFLQNVRLSSQEARLAWLVSNLKGRINGSGIVYTLTIRDAEVVARWLRVNGLSAYAYSSGSLPPMDMESELRQELEAREAWQTAGGDSERTSVYRTFLEDMLLANRIRSLVATSALSMGFDKSDLAFVIHYQRPKSVVDYYQQVGRAGRGIDSAYGVLLNGEEDDKIADFFIRKAFPSEASVSAVLQAVAEAPRGLSIVELQKSLNLKRGSIEQILKFVMSDVPQPIVKDGTKYRATQFVGGYRIPKENIRRLTEIRFGECRQMDEYVRANGCLMRFLCKALESPTEDIACGRCAICRPDLALRDGVDMRLVDAALEFLNGKFFPIKPKKRWADSARAAAAFGIHVNANIPKEWVPCEGYCLSRYGVGTWGQLVREGKYGRNPPHFDDRLVKPFHDMLMSDWLDPDFDGIVVPVPSRRNPELVADFAERVARMLNVPCVRCLEKITDTPPQKDMENSVFQQNNLIDSFRVKPGKYGAKCILIDDMIDSGWTMTIAAARLYQAGFELVIPAALADTSNDGD